MGTETVFPSAQGCPGAAQEEAFLLMAHDSEATLVMKKGGLPCTLSLIIIVPPVVA